MENLQYVERLQNITARLVAKEAASLQVDTPLVIVGSYPYSVLVISGTQPALQIDSGWLEASIVDKSPRLIRVLRKALKVAHDYATVTLDNLSPPDAFGLIDAKTQFRRLHGEQYRLHPRYFSETITITLTCRLTGLSASVTVPASEQESAREELARSLSQEVLQHEETAKLIDTIEALRDYHATPAPVQSVAIVPYGNGTSLALQYVNKLEPILP